MTAEERSQSARIAAEARWAKLKALADEITEGTKALEDKVRKREAHRAKKKRLAKDECVCACAARARKTFFAISIRAAVF